MPPLNLVGDFGGGSLYLVMGMLAAILHAQKTGQGQVVDAAIVDGTLNLMSIIYSMAHSGLWADQRAANLLDGGAPFYSVYLCEDGKYLSVGALEPQFYAAFVAGLGLDQTELPAQHDRAGWEELRAIFAARIAEKPRAVWETIFAGTDACVAPVLNMAESAEHPHIKARNLFVAADGAAQPAPAPHLSATPGAIQPVNAELPRDPQEILAAWAKERI